MNILIINSILYTSENKRIPKVKSIKDCMIYNFALGFIKLGHNVCLIASEDYKPTEKESYEFDILFFKSNLKSIFQAHILPFHKNLYSYLKHNKKNFHLVISSEVFSISSLIASIVLPQKLVIWQELCVHNKKFFKLPSLFWYNCVAPLFYKNVCVVPRSTLSYSFIRRYLKKVSDVIVEHGINPDKFILSSFKNRQFIVVSQLIKRKRIDLIIKQFDKFVKDFRYSDYKLFIIGKGDEEHNLKQYVSNLGISEYVLFCGFLSHEELSPILAQSKALLVNTEKDLNMVSIPEAIMSGTPIVMNSVPASSFYVQNEKLGIVKDNWNDKDLMEIADSEEYNLNCIKYRMFLSNVHSAEIMMKISVE